MGTSRRQTEHVLPCSSATFPLQPAAPQLDEPGSSAVVDGTADDERLLRGAVSNFVLLGGFATATQGYLDLRRSADHGHADVDLVETWVRLTVEHGELARQAFLDFGKGRLKAGLNFGDCFSYALANATGEPLLFKSNDFTQTDIQLA